MPKPTKDALIEMKAATFGAYWPSRYTGRTEPAWSLIAAQLTNNATEEREFRNDLDTAAHYDALADIALEQCLNRS